MGNQQVTDADLGWLAGVVDGEGSIAIQRCHHNTPSGRRGYYSARCQVVNTDPGIIAAVLNMLACLDVGHYVTESARAGCRMLITVRVDRFESIERLLVAISPHLRGEKRARAGLLLRFVRARMSHGKNVRGNRFLNVPYTVEEAATAEQLLHGNLNDYTRDLTESVANG